MTTFEIAELKVHAALEILKIDDGATKFVYLQDGKRTTVREVAELFLIKMLSSAVESEPPA